MAVEHVVWGTCDIIECMLAESIIVIIVKIFSQSTMNNKSTMNNDIPYKHWYKIRIKVFGYNL